MCVVQWKSRTEPQKEATHPRSPRQNLTRSDPSPEIPDKTSQDAPHPRELGQNLTRSDTSPEIPDETLQEAPYPRESRTKTHKKLSIPENTGQNLTRLPIYLVGRLVVVLRTSYAEASCWGKHNRRKERGWSVLSQKKKKDRTREDKTENGRTRIKRKMRKTKEKLLYWLSRSASALFRMRAKKRIGDRPTRPTDTAPLTPSLKIDNF